MDDDFDSDAFDESDFSDEEGGDITVTGDTTNQNQTQKVTKGQKHLEELKSSLGLTEFQNKAELKPEKRRRQKARRKLKKKETIHETQIQTKATKLKEKAAYISIIFGLFGGFLLFPVPDFSKSLLVGIMLPNELFPAFVSQSLLFLSFFVATVGPAIVIMMYDSFKRR